MSQLLEHSIHNATGRFSILPSVVMVVVLLGTEKVSMMVLGPLGFFAILALILGLRSRCTIVEIALLLFASATVARFVGLDRSDTMGAWIYWFTCLGGLSLVAAHHLWSRRSLQWSITVSFAIVLVNVGWIFYTYVATGFPRPGDWAGGFFENAHQFGIVIGILVVYTTTYVLVQKRFGYGLFLPILFFAFHLTATRQAEFAFGFGILAVLLMRQLRFRLLAGACVVVLFFLPNWQEFYVHVIRVELNQAKKVLGYVHTAKALSENPGVIPFGFGPGNFASRAAVGRSSPRDIAKSKLAVPPEIVSTPNPLKVYFGNLYSPEELQRVRKLGVTGTYFSPFSTIIALVGEHGVIGFTIFLALWYGIITKSLSVASRVPEAVPVALTTAVTAISFFVLFWYDNWIEYPRPMAMLAMLAALTLKYDSLSAIRGGTGDSRFVLSD